MVIHTILMPVRAVHRSKRCVRAMRPVRRHAWNLTTARLGLLWSRSLLRFLTPLLCPRLLRNPARAPSEAPVRSLGAFLSGRGSGRGEPPAASPAPVGAVDAVAIQSWPPLGPLTLAV